MNTKWIKRTVALVAVSGVMLIAAAPSAEAGTATGSFVVSTTVFGACTMATANLVFPNYTTGQVPNADGTSNFTVTCPAATAGVPVPVTLTMAPTGGTFTMLNGANPLPYSLCQDAACAATYANAAAGAPIGITNPAGQTVPVYGRIAGGLSPVAGAYAQTVNVTLTY